MRRKDVEDCEYLTIYLFINKVHCGLKICHFIKEGTFKRSLENKVIDSGKY